jgi:hypothetical protein
MNDKMTHPLINLALASMDFCALPLLQQSRPKIKKALLSSATFQVIFHTVQFICCDLQMIYDQSLRETFFFFFPRSTGQNFIQ